MKQLPIPPFLDLAHQFRMARPFQLLLGRCAVEFGMKVVTALANALGLFDDQGMGLGEGILANACDLPGDFDVRQIGSNCELMAADFASDDGLRELAEHG